MCAAFATLQVAKGKDRQGLVEVEARASISKTHVQAMHYPSPHVSTRKSVSHSHCRPALYSFGLGPSVPVGLPVDLMLNLAPPAHVASASMKSSSKKIRDFIQSLITRHARHPFTHKHYWSRSADHRSHRRFPTNASDPPPRTTVCCSKMGRGCTRSWHLISPRLGSCLGSLVQS